MRRPTVAVLFFGLLAGTLAAASLSSSKQQEITPAPAGPFHVSGNTILDSRGRAFLMRGTQLTEFHLQTVARDNRAGEDFGAHSATSLSAVRLRFNMNAVRLPVNVLEADAAGYFAELAKVVRRANEVDLLVILAAREPGAAMPTARTARFWERCAAYFKDYPNVMFDVFSDPDGMNGLIGAVRSAGANQPVVVTGWKDDRMFEGSVPRFDDANVVYGVSPRFLNTRTDAQRDAHFGKLAESAPVIANWDLELHDDVACAAVPSDPAAAAEMVEGALDYFDAHGISWTASVLEPGKLVNDLSFHDATTLENGWTCGQPFKAGLGRVIEAHMRASQERGLFAVGEAGGADIARGAVAIAYGPILAAYDARHTGSRAPLSLGRMSVEVTDALGVTRPAGMLWASAGWGQTNFLIPRESAVGPAAMTIVRDDGSRLTSNITIADTAPGFLTGYSCRGPAVGLATEIFRDGRKSSTLVSSCKGTNCKTVAIPMSRGSVTRVRLVASGFRYAVSARDIEVTIGGVRVPVVSYGPDKDGTDFVTIQIPDSLRGVGETDLLSHINGRISNAVRIYVGGEKAAPTRASAADQGVRPTQGS
jgi:uncharacterized protein (TIGR03437 family)